MGEGAPAATARQFTCELIRRGPVMGGCRRVEGGRMRGWSHVGEQIGVVRSLQVRRLHYDDFELTNAH